LVETPWALNQVYQIGSGRNWSLMGLYEKIRAKFPADANIPDPIYLPDRGYDYKISKSKIGSAQAYLGYKVVEGIDEGLTKTIQWYAESK
jgi:nucleoside-diphosphate-sugar epimerase